MKNQKNQLTDHERIEILEGHVLFWRVMGTLWGIFILYLSLKVHGYL